jgi:hypothetical protein
VSEHTEVPAEGRTVEKTPVGPMYEMDFILASLLYLDFQTQVAVEDTPIPTGTESRWQVVQLSYGGLLL